MRDRTISARTSRMFLALTGAACLSLLIGVEVFGEEEEDWPVLIVKLRQQLQHMPGHASTRKQLAVAYNNYGVSLSEQGQWQQAVEQVEEAIRVDPSNPQFQTNLARVHLQVAQAAYQANRFDEAKTALDRVLALEPNSAQAYYLVGEIEYHSQRLKEARAAWQKALALDPSSGQVKERLERLNEEFSVESKFERLSQAWFDIRYTEGLERSTGFDIRDALLDARRSVGSDFAYWPKHKLVVLVYSAEEFRKLRREMPDWVAGQYDGKIRVPLPGQGLDQQAVNRTLVHEYTHAIAHDVTNDRLPTWFNEGLAEYEAWKGTVPPWPMLRQAVATGTVLPWSNLSAQFSLSLSGQAVMLGYEQSHSIVRYLVDRYGFWRIRKLLQAVASGSELETALAAELHTKLTRLEADWQKWLKDTLAQSLR